MTAIAAVVALLAVPMSGQGGSRTAAMNITVDVRPSSSFKVQNGADLAPAGFTGMASPAPVLVINSPPVMPEVVVEVSADVAGPVTSKPTGESTDAGGQGGDNSSKQLTLKDLGVSSPPSSRRTEGSDLKQAFERAAGEIVYRLDLLNKINVGRQSPVIVSINL